MKPHPNRLSLNLAAPSYSYPATLARVVDGDTAYFTLTMDYELQIDFGFHILDTVAVHKSALQDFRFNRINAPEMNTDAGKAAKVHLEGLLAQGSLRVVTGKSDKYGRWLAEVFVTPPGGVEFNVNDQMVADGFAVPYMVT